MTTTFLVLLATATAGPATAEPNPTPTHMEVHGESIALSDGSYGDNLEGLLRARGRDDLAEQTVRIRDNRMSTVFAVAPALGSLVFAAPMAGVSVAVTSVVTAAATRPEAQQFSRDLMAQTNPWLVAGVGGAVVVTGALVMATTMLAAGLGTGYLIHQDEQIANSALQGVVAEYNRGASPGQRINLTTE